MLNTLNLRSCQLVIITVDFVIINQMADVPESTNVTIKRMERLKCIANIVIFSIIVYTCASIRLNINIPSKTNVILIFLYEVASGVIFYICIMGAFYQLIRFVKNERTYNRRKRCL